MKAQKYTAMFFAFIGVAVLLGTLSFLLGNFTTDAPAPGWGWARVTTSLVLSSMAASAVVWIGFGIVKLSERKLGNNGYSAAMECVLEALGAVGLIGFFPSLIWWGLYLG